MINFFKKLVRKVRKMDYRVLCKYLYEENQSLPKENEKITENK